MVVTHCEQQQQWWLQWSSYPGAAGDISFFDATSPKVPTGTVATQALAIDGPSEQQPGIYSMGRRGRVQDVLRVAVYDPAHRSLSGSHFLNLEDRTAAPPGIDAAPAAEHTAHDDISSTTAAVTASLTAVFGLDAYPDYVPGIFF